MFYLIEVYIVYINLMSLLFIFFNEEEEGEELREIICVEDVDLLLSICFWSWEFLFFNFFNLVFNLVFYNIKIIYCKINFF